MSPESLPDSCNIPCGSMAWLLNHFRIKTALHEADKSLFIWSIMRMSEDFENLVEMLDN
jgi:hypothetical protein